MPTLSFDKRIFDTVLAVALVRYQEMADVAHPAAAPQEQQQRQQPQLGLKQTHAKLIA